MATAVRSERVASSASATDFSLTVARSVLKDAVATLGAVALTKSTMPVANCIKLDVGDDMAVMVATNFDTTLTLSVPVSSRGSGSVCIPAKRLGDILANLDGAFPVTLAVSQERVRITAGRAKFDVPTMPVAEFPLMPGVDRGQSLELDAAALVDRISRAVRFSFTVDPQKGGFENRRGVCIDMTSAGIVAVATTGQILARFLLAARDQRADAQEYFIPNGAVPGIVRLFSVRPDGARITLQSDENRMALTCGDRRAVVSLSGLRYVQYAQVLPSDVTHRVRCERAGLVAAVRRVALAAPSAINRIRLTLDGSSQLRLSAQSEEAGQSEDLLTLESYDGPASVTAPFHMECNASLLLVALEGLDGDAVDAAITNDNRPIVFHGTNGTDLTLVMPLRIV